MTPEQYKEWHDWRVTVDDRLNKLDGGHVRLSDKLEYNTTITLGMKDALDKLITNLGELPEFLAEGRVSLRFLARIRRLAQWLLYYFVMPAASALAAIYFYKNGFFPDWFISLIEFIRELGGFEK